MAGSLLDWPSGDAHEPTTLTTNKYQKSTDPKIPKNQQTPIIKKKKTDAKHPITINRPTNSPNPKCRKCNESKIKMEKSRYVKIKKTWLIRLQPFRRDLGLLRVVPRPCPCHEAAEPLPPSLFGVLVHLSADRVLLPPIWQHLWRKYCLLLRVRSNGCAIKFANPKNMQ